VAEDIVYIAVHIAILQKGFTQELHYQILCSFLWSLRVAFLSPDGWLCMLNVNFILNFLVQAYRPENRTVLQSLICLKLIVRQ